MIDSEMSLVMINSPVRKITAAVTRLGSPASTVFRDTDRLKSFSIERVGEAKFFGFGICQKANIKLLDKNRELTFTTDDVLEITYSVSSHTDSVHPKFTVTEVHRDENTNELSITAYDKIYKTANNTVNELDITAPYTLREFAIACAAKYGLTLYTLGISSSDFNISYEEGANFNGTETIRTALNMIAEATQSIYYIDANDRLVFKRLDKSVEPLLTITKDHYITLDSKTNRRLTKIVSTTELGESISAELSQTGSTQYIRNNAFLDMRDDIGTLVDTALNNVGGLSINQFTCSWRGNYLLELGDKIALVTKDNDTVESFLLNDTLSYNGGLSQKSQWSLTEETSETVDNPTTLGEVLKNTYAKVNKIDKEIDLVASETSANTSAISALNLTTESVSTEVQRVEKVIQENVDGLQGELTELTNRVNATVTAEEMKIQIEQQLTNGATSVVTSTGFTFDEAGLTIEKSGSEMHTQITEDGMTVYKNNEEMLVADNVGVKATNLQAVTYLIIGKNSRFEDYEKDGESRTGCFWIGG